MESPDRRIEELRDRLRRMAFGLDRIGSVLQELKALAMLEEVRGKEQERFRQALEELREMLTELLTLLMALPEDQIPETEEVRKKAITFLDLANEIQDLLEGGESTQ